MHNDGSSLQAFFKNFHFTRSLTILPISTDDYFNRDQLKSEAKIKQQTNKECSKSDILKKMQIKLDQRISLGSSSFKFFFLFSLKSQFL